jgi:RNA polymerase sigma factor (sigma-70 family)
VWFDTTMNAGLETLPDALLVVRCRRGDRDAWDELVNRFSRYVYAIAVRAYRLDRDEAEEVFQEVFARVYQRLDSLRDDDALRPWIGQLTRRMCVDRIRSRSRDVATDELELEADEDELRRVDDALTVHQAMDGMSEDCREILDRFFCRDQTYSVIGGQLGIPPGTIASRISRCLAKLREVLGR